MTEPKCSLSIADRAHQSPPIDFNTPFEFDFMRGKTVLITGGASGIGSGLSAKLAEHGATVIIGDIDIKAGSELVSRLRKETGNENLHCLLLDVTSWTSQLSFFREAVELSPHGGIDAVVANAGISIGAESLKFEMPNIDYQNTADAPPPELKTLEVTLTGTMYTTHLALYYLKRNPNSVPCSPTRDPSETSRDRHILFIGSIASLYPIISQVPYCAAKHGVLGIFRSLRATAPVTSGIRVNLLCPYFIDTPFINPTNRAFLSGIPFGTVDDAVKAASRLLADLRCIGRSVVVGPKLKIRQPVCDHGQQLAAGGSSGVPDVTDIYELSKDNAEVANAAERAPREISLWECYAHDLEDTEVFCARMLRIFNAATEIRGWTGFFRDMLMAVFLLFIGSFVWKWRK